MILWYSKMNMNSQSSDKMCLTASLIDNQTWDLNELWRICQNFWERINVYITEKKMRKYDHKHEARKNLFFKC